MAESSRNGKEHSEDPGDRAKVTTTGETSPAGVHLTYSESSPGDAGAGETGPSEGAEELLARGTAVGRYLVLERLGAGAMGVVYAAYDPKLDRKIALKVLRPNGRRDDGRRSARLEREAQAIAKLSHPNVVAIYDVGVHQDQVFLAMEYLAGGTLRDWTTAAKRPWRETIELFIEVGKGLAAAHAEGLIHRDFKPDNVLLDKTGAPKVVDFGLVRLERAPDAPAGGADPEAPLARDSGAVALTRTGALAGTPAYMASEQFLGQTIDARTDQFAFCVALYEALFGERPFAGQTFVALAASVVTGQVREPVKDAEVPAWVRRVIALGLASDPAARWGSMELLTAALRNDPAVKVKRRAIAGCAIAVAVITTLGIRHLVLQRREALDRQVAEIARQVAEHVKMGDASLTEAARERSHAREVGDGALTAFDTFQRDKGETLWAECLTLRKDAAAAYETGIQHLEAAEGLAPQQAILARIGDALVDYTTLEGRTSEEQSATLKRLASYDEGRERLGRLTAPAILRVATAPAGILARIETYDPITHRSKGPGRALGPTPVELSLPAGSYRLSFDETAERAGFHAPILVAAGERQNLSLPVPRRSDVPEGFVYVPAGRFLFGSADEDSRAIFLETTPLHAVTTPPFLISKYETTIGEWIAFINDLPAKDRDLRRPRGQKDLVAGFLDLRKGPSGTWQFLFRATETLYQAAEGERFRYSDRDRRASQDWMRFPVAGISPGDALEYAAWLNRTGRVPGARLCNEREWERAERGADARAFPHGDRLSRDDANFDLTYGRKSGAYGPDEVGSHPASVSPFGVEDMVGNVWEITYSVLDKDQFVARGGSFYQNLRTMLSSNRDPISAATRDHTIGLRICAEIRP